MNELCRVFYINLSSYYYQPVTASAATINVMTLINNILIDSGNTYGKRHIHAELVELGHEIGVHKTRTFMKRLNIKAIRPKKRHYYPNSGKEHKYAPNLLKRHFNPVKINTHWVGDITYLKTYQGWSYLECVLDLASKEIVGYVLSQTPDAKLANEALLDAVNRQQPNTRKLMFHSDQGIQYSAKIFRDKLALLNITQSMSRRGNCWDNAVMEWFFRSLKTERLNNITFINHLSVVDEVESYIRFYNYKRRYSSIEYMTLY